MAVYILTLLILIFPYLWRGTVWDSSQKRALLCFWVLFLVSGLSYNLGADTRGSTIGYGYVENYRRIPGLFDLKWQDFSSETWQPGFVIIMSFFKTFTSNYLYYQIFHSFVINIIIVYFLRNNTKYLGLSLFFYCMLYYLDMNFEIQRESFAIVLGLLIYSYLEKHVGARYNLIATGIAILGTALFHRSAFVLIFYPLLKNVRINKMVLTICFFTTLFIQSVWVYFSNYAIILDVITGDVYNGYVKNQLNEYVGGGLNYQMRLALINVIIPYVFVFFSYKKDNPRYIVFALLSIAFECLADFTFAFHRFYGYFAPFYWLVLTDGVVYLGKKIKLMRTAILRVALIAGMMVYIVYTYHMVYFSEDPATKGEYVYNRYFPYQSVLESGNSYVH